jgi:hypothetical protein
VEIISKESHQHQKKLESAISIISTVLLAMEIAQIEE